VLKVTNTQILSYPHQPIKSTNHTTLMIHVIINTTPAVIFFHLFLDFIFLSCLSNSFNNLAHSVGFVLLRKLKVPLERRTCSRETPVLKIGRYASLFRPDLCQIVLIIFLFAQPDRPTSAYRVPEQGVKQLNLELQEGLPWVETMSVNCTSLTENIYILKGRKALLQLNEEKSIVLYEGCLLMIHGRVEEKHESGQCFEIRAR
ncbi:unnamed protein product, partial [Brassica oleracea var. botrytis]